MGKKELNAKVDEILKLCNEQGVKLPTDAKNARMAIGTTFSSHDGENAIAQTIEDLKEKYGVSENLDPKEEDNKVEDGEKVKKKRAAKTDGTAKTTPKAEVAENQAISDILMDLCGFEFKNAEKFKGSALSKAAKAIRECDTAITSGKQAQKLKGIGPSTGKKIDQFLETGTMERLEEYRAGDL